MISNEYMMEMLQKVRPYTVVILHRTEKAKEAGMDKVVWEHARRNFELRAEGKLAVVCPITDATDVAGLGIFSTNEEETKKIMESDPGVQAGIFIFEIHPSKSFPGDQLPT